MDIQKKNLNSLKRLYPNIHDKLKGLKSSWNLVDSKRGGKTLALGKVYLHSRYDPLREAQQFIDRQDTSVDSTWIVCGMGLGYHVRELLERLVRYNLIVIIEPEMAVFNEALKCFDMTALFEDERIKLYVGDDADYVYDDLAKNFFKFMAAGFTVLEWKSSVALHEKYFSDITTKLKDVILLGYANVKTVKLSGRRMIANVVSNMPYIFESPGVKSLENKATGLGGIIVSAGPSLNKNVAELKKAKGKLLIASTDTALKILLRNGIKPDFVVTMDYKPESAKHFEGQDTKDIPMVFDAASAPESLEAYCGPLISSLSTKPMPLWVGHINENKGILDKGMSVAHTVFNLLKMMGCSKIIFVGQDLAFPGGKTHAEGTHSREEVVADGKNYFWAKSEVTGEELLTRNDMYVYLKHFERMVREYDIHCVNATEGGLGIKGAEHISLKEAIAKYGAKDNAVEKLMTELSFEKVTYDKRKVTEEISQLLKDFSDMQTAAQKVVVELNALLGDLRAQNELDQAQVRSVMNKIKSDIGLVRSKTLCLKLIHSEFVKELLQMHREGELSQKDIVEYSKDEMIQSLEEDMSFQETVDGASEFMMGILDEVIDKLNPSGGLDD